MDAILAAGSELLLAPATRGNASSNRSRSWWHTRGVIDQLRAAAESLNRGDPEPFAALMAEHCEWRGPSRGPPWGERTPASHRSPRAPVVFGFHIPNRGPSPNPGPPGLAPG